MKGLKYYSVKELFLRILWLYVNCIFFRISPRHLYFWRNFILRIFGAKIGEKVKIYPSVQITFPWLLEIGDNTVISWGVKVYNLGKITIGSKTVISQYAHLCGGTHDYKSSDFNVLRTGLTVGNNVWIAADAFIGPGVVIKDGAIVAARAVVVKDVQQNSMVGGNPAKEIRNRS